MAITFVILVDRFFRDLPFEIGLAPDNVNETVWDGFLDSIIIVRHFLKRFGRTDIVDQDAGITALIVRGDNRLILVLARSIVI